MEKERMDQVLLVGVNLNNASDFEQSMEELAALAEACQMEVVGRVDQKMSLINKEIGRAHV